MFTRSLRKIVIAAVIVTAPLTLAATNAMAYCNYGYGYHYHYSTYGSYNGGYNGGYYHGGYGY